jgi:hypothetical protein
MFLPFHLCQNLLAVVNLTLESDFEVVGIGATVNHFTSCQIRLVFNSFQSFCMV